MSSCMDIVEFEDERTPETIHMATSKNSGSGAPLRPVVFAVFLALNEHALHGYAIMKAVNDRLRHRAIVGPGTLYRTLKELRDQHLITHTQAPAGEDSRRQYYELTEAGRALAAAEAAHLADLVAAARAGHLIPEGGSGQ